MTTSSLCIRLPHLRGSRHFVIAIIVGLATAGALAAQTRQPMGSVVIAGTADSTMQRFIDYLGAHQLPLRSVDRTRRIVVTRPAGASEDVGYRFTARGTDSTRIEAMGAQGSMTALIFGLGLIEHMLDTSRVP
jgi:hypothetical protein